MGWSMFNDIMLIILGLMHVLWYLEHGNGQNQYSGFY